MTELFNVNVDCNYPNGVYSDLIVRVANTSVFGDNSLNNTSILMQGNLDMNYNRILHWNSEADIYSPSLIWRPTGAAMDGVYNGADSSGLQALINANPNLSLIYVDSSLADPVINTPVNCLGRVALQGFQQNVPFVYCHVNFSELGQLIDIAGMSKLTIFTSHPPDADPSNDLIVFNSAEQAVLFNNVNMQNVLSGSISLFNCNASSSGVLTFTQCNIPTDTGLSNPWYHVLSGSWNIYYYSSTAVDVTSNNHVYDVESGASLVVNYDDSSVVTLVNQTGAVNITWKRLSLADNEGWSNAVANVNTNYISNPNSGPVVGDALNNLYGLTYPLVYSASGAFSSTLTPTNNPFDLTGATINTLQPPSSYPMRIAYVAGGKQASFINNGLTGHYAVEYDVSFLESNPGNTQNIQIQFITQPSGTVAYGIQELAAVSNSSLTSYNVSGRCFLNWISGDTGTLYFVVSQAATASINNLQVTIRLLQN